MAIRILEKCLMVAVLAMGLCSCETVGKRISANQEMFNAWSPETQQQVQAGKIQMGFDRDMVLVALGRPQQIKERTSEAGASEIWTYLGTRTKQVISTLYYPPGSVYCPPTRRGNRGHYHHPVYQYTPVIQYETYERRRIVFFKGKVIEFEVMN
jgi:hypothetical protein